MSDSASQTTKAVASRGTVLVVDDDPTVAGSLTGFLAEIGYSADAVSSGESALARLADADLPEVQVVLSDMSMPRMDGLELLREINRTHPAVAVIMLTGYGTIESAVQALRMGAIDYLTKPAVDNELRVSLERAFNQQALLAENKSLRSKLEARDGLGAIVGEHPRMRRVFELIEAVAPSRTTVLMSGESGTGKSLVARAIHHHSPRRDGPYVELACGSIPETLLESELFGHVKGAFTGAHTDKVGRFLAADGGTLFLDEINSASPAMQLKLLRVLQERRFEPVGSTETIESDVRVVLASNQSLEALVERGDFRQDLYYRINVVQIELPPLRERAHDVPVLAGRFLEKYAAELGRQITGFEDGVVDALTAYHWPGNVRELENVVHRAAVLAKQQRVSLDDLPPEITGRSTTAVVRPGAPGTPGTPGSRGTPREQLPLTEALAAAEREILLSALDAHDWSRQQTAATLGINRATLYKKMKALDIDPDRDGARLAG